MNADPTEISSGDMKCPLCDFRAKYGENEIIGHLLIEHNLPSKIAVEMGQKRDGKVDSRHYDN